MKNVILALSLFATFSPASRAHDLTPEERTRAISYLERTRDGVLAATKGLSPTQWNFKSGPDRWSVAEVAEHIAAAEDFLMERVKNDVMKAPARTGADDVKKIDEFVMKAIADRSKKVQAPEPLRPNNRFESPKGSLKHFIDSRAKTIKFLKDQQDLREHATDSPLGKQLDGYEWLLFIGAHSERHTKQMDEVKADPGFPKK